jgi:hypothetical protein
LALSLRTGRCFDLLTKNKTSCLHDLFKIIYYSLHLPKPESTFLITLKNKNKKTQKTKFKLSKNSLKWF